MPIDRAGFRSVLTELGDALRQRDVHFSRITRDFASPLVPVVGALEERKHMTVAANLRLITDRRIQLAEPESAWRRDLDLVGTAAASALRILCDDPPYGELSVVLGATMALGNQDPVTAAMAAVRRGMVPERYVFADGEAAHIKERLAAMGFTNVDVPDAVDWRPSRSMSGVAHGNALFSDPLTGTVVIPIYMAYVDGYTPYAEHIHVGVNPAWPAEQVLFFRDSGGLQDNLGKYDVTSAYSQTAGSIHTPRTVIRKAAAFLGIAWGGVVMTGMQGTQGADLLTRYEVSGAILHRLFVDVAPTAPKGKINDRDVLAEYLFAQLAWGARESTEPAIRHQLTQQEVANWLAGLATMKPNARVAWARNNRTAHHPPAFVG